MIKRQESSQRQSRSCCNSQKGREGGEREDFSACAAGNLLRGWEAQEQAEKLGNPELSVGKPVKKKSWFPHTVSYLGHK